MRSNDVNQSEKMRERKKRIILNFLLKEVLKLK